MNKALVFKVVIKGLEDRINREIALDENMTINDLAASILTAFNSLGHHEYTVKYNKDKYEKSDDEKYLALYGFKNASTTKLCDLNFGEDNVMQMDYDLHDCITFEIEFLRTVDKNLSFPMVLNGIGSGMIEGINGKILKDIIEDIELKGFSKYSYTKEYGLNIKYDYREFNLEKLKSEFKDKYLKMR